MKTFRGRAIVPTRLGPIQIGRPWAVLTVDHTRVELSHRLLPHSPIRLYSSKLLEYTAESGLDKRWLGLRRIGDTAWTWFSADGEQSVLDDEVQAVGGRRHTAIGASQVRPRRFTMAASIVSFTTGVISFLLGSAFPNIVDHLIAPLRNPYQGYGGGVFLFHGFGVIAVVLSFMNVAFVLYQDRAR